MSLATQITAAVNQAFQAIGDVATTAQLVQRIGEGAYDVSTGRVIAANDVTSDIELFFSDEEEEGLDTQSQCIVYVKPAIYTGAVNTGEEIDIIDGDVIVVVGKEFKVQKVDRIQQGGVNFLWKLRVEK